MGSGACDLGFRVLEFGLWAQNQLQHKGKVKSKQGPRAVHSSCMQRAEHLLISV